MPSSENFAKRGILWDLSVPLRDESVSSRVTRGIYYRGRIVELTQIYRHGSKIIGISEKNSDLQESQDAIRFFFRRVHFLFRPYHTDLRHTVQNNVFQVRKKRSITRT